MPAFPCLAVATALVMPAFAAGPPQELAEALASRLITLQSGNRTGQIRVAVILEGSTHCDSFETRHVRRVIAVHPVITEGGLVRQARTYDFQWNPTYGWFTWQKRGERGGEAIWIWSETQGEVVVR